MRLTKESTVGIGTTRPDGLLHVFGGDAIVTGGSVGIGTNNPLRPLHIESTDCRIRLTDSDVTTDVELQNNNGNAVLTTNGASSLKLQTNNNPRLVIDSDGHVGINEISDSSTVNRN